MKKQMRVHLDFETYCDLPISKGAWEYSQHPSLYVWCCAYKTPDQPVKLWVPGDACPPEIQNATEIHAFNAAFERYILKHVLTPRLGWPKFEPEQFFCTQALSMQFGGPDSLDKVGAYFGLSVSKGDGSAMRKLSKPTKEGEKPEPEPELLEDLYRYCKQDVETEAALFDYLNPLLP